MTASHQHDPLPESTGRLFDQAVHDHGARILWNMRPRRTRAGVISLARALETRGGLAEALLADELRRSLDGADEPISAPGVSK
jgi:hypothetical protein